MLQCDVADSDDNGYKAAAKAASHPNPEAYCEFVMQSLAAVRSTVRSLLRASHMLSPGEILRLSALLSFSSAEALEPTIQLTKDALKRITNYNEDFLTQQSFVHGKVEVALRSYEQYKVSSSFFFCEGRSVPPVSCYYVSSIFLSTYIDKYSTYHLSICFLI